MSAKKQFIQWVKINDPFLYAVAKQRGTNELNGIGDFFNNLVNTVKEVAPQVMQYNRDRRLLDAQVARAQQGQPPLPTPPTYTPSVPPAQQGTPQFTQAATAVAQEADNKKSGNTALILGAGLVATLFFLRK